MRLGNVLSGLLLTTAMVGGCGSWVVTGNFVLGSIVFIGGALIAGCFHKK